MSWKPEVTPGNVISWGVSMVVAVAAVVWLQADVREQGHNADRLADRVAKLEASDVVITGRIDAVRDQAMVRQEAIVARLARIETILERIERQTPGLLTKERVP